MDQLQNTDDNHGIVISTWANRAANEAAWQVIGRNGAALDAVEAGVKISEADPDEMSVGYGGRPDRDGNVTAQDVATGLNVNENGILIESNDYINARFVQIMAQTKQKATIKVKGEIIYSMQSAGGKFRTGIAFEDTPETALLFIDEMIQASLAKDQSN